LEAHPSVNIIALPSPPQSLQTGNKLIFLVAGPLKVLLQVWQLWSVLAYQTGASEWMLVQNPPSIPTLMLAVSICYFKRTKLVIDWHNFGYSVLALKLGQNHPLVQVSKVYEQLLGKFATAHFAVTDAMGHVLRSEFAITSPVLSLHDRPAPLFMPLSPSDRIAFLIQHELTTAKANEIIDGKTRLVVSSTSWTPDEDFSVLLKALCDYSTSAITDSPQLPELLVIITGKGALRQHYIDAVEALEAKQELEMVTIKTAWLSYEDYASLLGAADLGVSLHTSSSGVDLPMKVVDMFGAGTPVLGYNNFKAWSELVQEDVNGKGFSNAEQMAGLMKLLFDPANKQLDVLRDGALKASKRRWDSEWKPIAGRLFGLAT